MSPPGGESALQECSADGHTDSGRLPPRGQGEYSASFALGCELLGMVVGRLICPYVPNVSTQPDSQKMLNLCLLSE